MSFRFSPQEELIFSRSVVEALHLQQEKMNKEREREREREPNGKEN